MRGRGLQHLRKSAHRTGRDAEKARQLRRVKGLPIGRPSHVFVQSSQVLVCGMSV
jgi:hypothetical protein